jgi:hypothetical protein
MGNSIGSMLAVGPWMPKELQVVGQLESLKKRLEDQTLGGILLTRYYLRLRNATWHSAIYRDESM